MLMIMMVSSPSLAETEESIHSIGGTSWEGICLFPPHQTGQPLIELGFYKGKVFINGPFGIVALPSSFYLDLPGFSCFKAQIPQGDIPPCILDCYPTTLFGIIQPAVKSGTVVARIHFLFYITQTKVALLHELNGSWVPDQH